MKYKRTIHHQLVSCISLLNSVCTQRSNSRTHTSIFTMALLKAPSCIVPASSEYLGTGVSALQSSIRVSSGARPVKAVVTMGNAHEGKGLFAPIVVVVKNAMGQKQFNQLRGKGIALHSQVIIVYACRCSTIGLS